MLRRANIPDDLQHWLEAAVVTTTPPELTHTHYPAMVASMLVVRLAGEVALDGQPVPPAAWISASRRARSFAHQGAVQAVGLVLRPETAVCLWAAARGVVDQVLTLDAVAGPAWALAGQQLRGAATDEARLEALFAVIRAALAASAHLHALRDEVLALMARAADPQAAGSAAPGVGRRQFERRFSALLGMAPGHFQRIARHNQALRHAAADPDYPAAQLALDADYCDQAHLARDMQRFAGHPLRALRTTPRPAVDAHWPLTVGASTHQRAERSRKR